MPKPLPMRVRATRFFSSSGASGSILKRVWRWMAATTRLAVTSSLLHRAALFCSLTPVTLQLEIARAISTCHSRIVSREMPSTSASQTISPPWLRRHFAIAWVSAPLPPLARLAPLLWIMAFQPSMSPLAISLGAGPDCAESHASAVRMAGCSKSSSMSAP